MVRTESELSPFGKFVKGKKELKTSLLSQWTGHNPSYISRMYLKGVSSSKTAAVIYMNIRKNFPDMDVDLLDLIVDKEAQFAN